MRTEPSQPPRAPDEVRSAMRDQVQHVLDGFLPAMEQIQALDATDEEKKRLAKDWLRSKLYSLVNELEKAGPSDRPQEGRNSVAKE